MEPVKTMLRFTHLVDVFHYQQMYYRPMGGSQTINVSVYTSDGGSPTNTVDSFAPVFSWVVKELYIMTKGVLSCKSYEINKGCSTC